MIKKPNNALESIQKDGVVMVLSRHSPDMTE